jgi:hypothetical protein
MLHARIKEVSTAALDTRHKFRQRQHLTLEFLLSTICADCFVDIGPLKFVETQSSGPTRT